MPVDANTYCTLDSKSLLIYAPGFILEIDKYTGEWRQVTTQPDGNKIVPHGGSCHSFDLRVDNRWLSAGTGPSILRWEQRTEDAQFVIVLEMKMGPFHIRQWIRLEPDGTGFQRSLDLRYQGKSMTILQAIDLSLPAFALAESDPGRLVLPNHAAFHILDFKTLCRRGITREKVDEDYARGYRSPCGVETFPDSWNGVIGICHRTSQTGLLTYMSPSPVPVAFAFRELGKGFAISALQRQEMILHPGGSLSTASQYVQFFNSSWEAALEGYQKRLISWGYRAPEDAPTWLTGATLYETSILQWGGCRALSKALPDLRHLGVEVLNLLPIWSAAEVTEDMRLTWRLDPSWQGRTIPHRLTDFESMDPEVGKEEDVRRLVAAAHKLGLRVVLDYVFHGISEPSWLIQRRPHWLVRNPDGDAFASHGWEPGYSLDWANPSVQDFLVEFGVRLIKTFDLDGLRIHAPFWKESNWKPTDDRQPCATNLSGLAIVDRLRREIRRIRPDAALLGEAHGPEFVARCDMLRMDNVLSWLARLGRDEIDTRELHDYLADLRLCYPVGTRLLFSLENYDSGCWEPSPRALRGSAISRPLLAVAALAGDAISLYHGQEQAQEKFLHQLLRVRKSNRILREGQVLHRGVRWKGTRQLAWIRHLDSSLALITANFDSIWRRVIVELDTKLLPDPKKGTFHHRRLSPGRSSAGRVDREVLRHWPVSLDPYSIAIDVFEG